MNTSLTVVCEFHVKRCTRGAKKVFELGPEPPRPPARTPRVARFMALAIRLDQRIKEGLFANQQEIGDIGGVTRARVAQIMSLLNLAPDIQESILFLPLVDRGRDPIVLRDLLPIAAITDWDAQREKWKWKKGCVFPDD